MSRLGIRSFCSTAKLPGKMDLLPLVKDRQIAKRLMYLPGKQWPFFKAVALPIPKHRSPFGVGYGVLIRTTVEAIGPRAVDRNYARRRLREACRLVMPSCARKGCDGKNLLKGQF